jgi:hypothetical protein
MIMNAHVVVEIGDFVDIIWNNNKNYELSPNSLNISSSLL